MPWLACAFLLAGCRGSGSGAQTAPTPAEPVLTVADVSVAEDNPSGELVFTVRLDRASAASATVLYTTRNGTAASPADFAPNEGMLTFSPGATAREVRVSVTDDLLYEGEEGLALVLSNPTNASIGRDFAVGRILDDETPPILEVLDVSVAEGSGGSQLVFDLVLSEVSAIEASLSYATVDGTATNGADYASVQGVAVFPPGMTTVNVSVPVIDDSIDEFDEPLNLEFSSASELVLASASVAGIIVDDDPLPTLAIDDADLPESGGVLTFFVRLSHASGKPVTVDYSSTNSSASGGMDYAAVAGTHDFQPGEVEKTIVVSVLGDAVFEGQESFLVTLSSAANAVLGQAIAVGTILDDDPPPPDPPAQITVTDVVVTEGDAGTASAIFTVQLSEPESGDASIRYTAIAGTATASIDFVETTGTLVFPAGTTTGSIVVDVVGDMLGEGDETFRISLSNALGNIVFADSTADATILDNDPLPRLSISDSSVTEGNAGNPVLSLTVRLSGPSGRTASVDFATSDGTATSGSDYVAVSGTLSFDPGDITETISVPVFADLLHEGDETFTVSLADAEFAVIADGLATVTLENDDGQPLISIDDSQRSEGNAGAATMSFAVELSEPSTQNVTVDYSTSNGTATAGLDYTATGGTLAIPVGASSGVIDVAIIGDAIDEVDEAFTLTLAVPVNAGLADAVAQGTITDDDAAPSLSITDASLLESGGNLVFAVHLSAVSGKVVVADYASADSSALGGADYTPVTGSIELQPGEDEETIAVPILSDAIFEGQESFLVTLSSVANATLGQATAVGTITDDDPPPVDPPAQITVTDVTVTEGDAGTVSATFAVQLSEAESAAASIAYATVAGTATASADFVATTGTLVFPAGTTSGSIVVPVVGDTLDEDNETFRISLSNATGNIVFADSTGDATIVDNDDLPSLSISDSTVTEGNADNPILSLTVSLSAASGRTVSVDFITSDGTATSGSDYQAVAGTLNFAPGDLAEVISVPISGDSLHEGDETFAVSLADPEFADIADGVATATIANDDGQPAISVSDASIGEGDSGTVALTFSLTLSSPSGLPVSVNFATGNGTAIAGQDYAAASGTASFAPGQTTVAVQVNVNGDALIEGDEAFVLGLSNAANASLATTLALGLILDDDGQPLISVDDSQRIEGNAGSSTMSFAVELSKPSALTITVDYSTSDGTATAGLDYTTPNGTLTIPAGATSAVVAVAVIGDLIDEVDETFTLTLADPVNAALGDAVAQGTVVDDDSVPSLSISDAVINEGALGAELSFTVNLSAVSSQTVTVDYSSTDGTALAGTDYTAVNGVLSFSPGETAEIVHVTVSDDQLDEHDELLQVHLANAQNASINDSSGSGTIADDDALPFLSITDASLVESGGNLVFAVHLSAVSGRVVAVDYASADSSALGGIDYTPVTGSIEFQPGEDEKTIGVPILGDLVFEGQESFLITLSSVANAQLTQATAVGTITDDDPAPPDPPAQITVTDVVVTEGDAGTVSATFTVQLTEAESAAASIAYATVAGTATASADFQVTIETLDFPAGTTSGSIVVPVVGDTLDEDDETFRISLSNAIGNIVFADPIADATIIDNDALPELSISDSTVTEGNAGNSVLSLTVSLSAPSGRTVSVDFATSNGTASSGSDYLTVSGTLSFAPGEIAQIISVPVIADSLHEGNETFAVSLSDAGFAVIADGLATATIANDDGAPAISVSDASIGEGDSGTIALTFSLTLSSPSGLPVSVNFATGNGTAIAGQDYAEASGTANFAPGQTTQAVQVNVIGDAIDEVDETFTLTLANPVNASLADGVAQGTVVDDDAVPSLTISDAVTNEGVAGAELSFTVSLSAISSHTVTVDYSSTDGTALAGTDYTAVNGSLSFSPGETTEVVHVTILDDLLDEEDEALQVQLTNAQNASINDSSGSGTITDNDALPTLTISDASVTEGNAGNPVLSLTVSLSAPSGRTVSVDFATGNGTATSGSDYQAVSGTLSFAPGDVAEVISVPISADALHEGDETFSVSLADPEFAVIADGLATATIANDDGAPAISVSDASIGEGDSGTVAVTFSLTLSSASGLPVNVDFATTNGSATAGQDYAAASGTASFAPGLTNAAVQVNVIGDTIDEVDETFTLTLANPVNAGLADGVAEGTVVDNDAVPSLSISDAVINEGALGAELAFTVSLSVVSGQTVTVNYSSTDGTALAGTDYTAVNGALTFSPGETTEVVHVTILDDLLDEEDEALQVQLTNAQNASISDGIGSGTITDDDALPALSISDSSLTEGNAGSSVLSLTVSLSAPSGRTVSVDFATSNGTAVAGQDYATASGTKTFTPGQTTQTVQVNVIGDAIDEVDETFTLTLTNPVNASLADGVAQGTVVDNDAEPSMTITDASAPEGDSGVSALTFTVGLSAPSGKLITVNYATADGTAGAGNDYAAKSGLLNFDPGVTALAITIDILGDPQEEADETLLVNLSIGGNVTFADSQATGTIVDDDSSEPPWGLDSRPNNLTCIAPERPVLDATISLNDPFPNLPPFELPLAMAQPPGDDSVWFVAEQPGRVQYFANDPGVSSATLAIDISAEVDDATYEAGLLGLAFHPEYSTPGSTHEGELFLSYTAFGPKSRISRFTTSDNWATWVEEIILEINRDSPWHNGGNIAFGPDGFLYIGIGDGGEPADLFGRAQDTTNLLGDMLRLDVDGPTPYAIPPGNPFSSNPTCPAGHSSATPCPEIYAWGFRNPWRWSFDSATGALWLGDVGEWHWEEIDLIELGGNYGWNVLEGTHCLEPSTGCDPTGLIEPIAEYDHDQGVSVVGGFVYRGSAIPELIGRYLFADAFSSRIWMLEDDGQGGYTRVELLDSSTFIASFAEGNDGELYLLDIGTGRIRSIVAGSGGGGGVDTIPTLLSETGCFDPVDPTVLASGLIPYTINASFWSDGAEKERYLAIPGGTTIDVGTDDDWTLPPGTVIVKNFRLAGQLFETRLLMRHPDGVWAGYTYEWNDNGTDATRVIGGKTKTINSQPWIYPSEGQCDNCHTLAAGFALGPESAQLNRDFTYSETGRTANQLTTLDHIALFSAPLPNVPNGQPTLADPTDTAKSLDSRARAYLHTNCSQCHRPLGPAPSDMDLRYETALSATNTCDVTPQHGDVGVADGRLIAPGDPSRSILLNRMSRRDVYGMPPLASNQVDAAGAALLASWIDSLTSCN